MENRVPKPLIRALKKHKYHQIGQHSAVKRCKWFYEALTGGRSCYKQKFYGIKSHQCIQMTPSLFHCTEQCLFCWRAQNSDLQISWDEMTLPNWDPPEDLIRGILNAQDKILSGYKGHIKLDHQKFREAHRPKHVAISLAGEPTLYEPLGEFIRILRAKDMTTFLVTNGSLPHRLVGLECEPTQLYVSVCASSKKMFKNVCRPQLAGAWEGLNETLECLPSFRCPTVIRSTLVKNHNMGDVEGYSKLIAKANPTYIEMKAYMHVGFSSLRLAFENMPTHKEVYDFALKLSKKTGYKIIDEVADSRVVLMSMREKPLRFDTCSSSII